MLGRQPTVLPTLEHPFRRFLDRRRRKTLLFGDVVTVIVKRTACRQPARSDEWPVALAAPAEPGVAAVDVTQTGVSVVQSTEARRAGAIDLSRTRLAVIVSTVAYTLADVTLIPTMAGQGSARAVHFRQAVPANSVADTGSAWTVRVPSAGIAVVGAANTLVIGGEDHVTTSTRRRRVGAVNDDIGRRITPIRQRPKDPGPR